MSEFDRKPQIRFKGFTEPWEQRKVGESFKVTRGYVLAVSKTRPTKEGTFTFPVYSSQTLNEGLMGFYNHSLFSDAVTWTTDGANAGTVKFRKGPFYCTNVCGVLVSESVKASKIVAEALNKIAYKHVSRVGNPKLMNNVMSDIYFYLPKTLDEQDLISNLFDSLDSLITLHQRKCDKLKTIKASLLKGMFPEKGVNTPKIRFKSFTEPWEQRKLGDIGSTFTGLSGKSANDFGHGEGKFLTYMNIFSNPVADVHLLENTEIDKSQSAIKYGDIFFTTSSETPEEVGMSSIWLGNGDNIYLNSFCFGYRLTEKHDPYYMAYMLRSNEVRKDLILLAQGISRYNISKTKVMDILIPTPSICEEKKIGLLFKDLDSLITLHQRKCEKLKNIKKSLLEQMFA